MHLAERSRRGEAQFDQFGRFDTIHEARKGKGKERKRIYIAPFIYYVYLKALRHGVFAGKTV